MRAATQRKSEGRACGDGERGLRESERPAEVGAGADYKADERPGCCVPFVVEHPERPRKRERREHRRHDHALDAGTGERAREPGSQQQHHYAEHTPELEARGEADECSRSKQAILARPEPGEHPQEWNDCLRGVAVDERDVRQPRRDCQQADHEAGPVGEPEPAEHEEKQRRDAEFDQERERSEVAHGAEQRQLEGAGLQLRVGEGVRPAARKKLLALVDEVDEVAGVRPSIEVGKAGGRSEDG